jgi:hypothetical protein
MYECIFIYIYMHNVKSHLFPLARLCQDAPVNLKHITKTFSLSSRCQSQGIMYTLYLITHKCSNASKPKHSLNTSDACVYVVFAGP